jgi:putative aminopeptidase FrvX
MSADEIALAGIRPGTRVVVAQSRRQLTPVGDLVSGYFLDDRADLVSWLLALKELVDSNVNGYFVATAAEEVGGEGALFFLNKVRPDVCVALELGPNVPDAPVLLNDQPTVWVTDGYATMQAQDVGNLSELGEKLGLSLQFQALSRGGSDASCAASHGLCARPITLGLPMDNTHGYEVMHPGAMENLAKLTTELVRQLG